jgi:hypothetical protein
VRILAFAAATAVGLGGCAFGSGSDTPGPVVTTTVTRHAHPKPQRTVIRDYRTYQAGQTGVLSSPSQHAALQIAVGPPSVSQTRLSKTYGYSPRNGNYVTFRLTISNTGQVPIEIQRLDFWLTTPGVKKTTTDDGNSPFSGSGSQLDTTELTPGQDVTNDLTFDVAHPTGTLFYGPGGRKQLAWTF